MRRSRLLKEKACGITVGYKKLRFMDIMMIDAALIRRLMTYKLPMESTRKQFISWGPPN